MGSAVTLGSLIAQLVDEADGAAALETLGDIVLYTDVAAMAERYEESVGAYVTGAVARFSAGAGEEDWLAVMGGIERAADPARATLARMLRWALRRDAEGDGGQNHTCECGGGKAAEACHGST
jgi:hypothetical protein